MVTPSAVWASSARTILTLVLPSLVWNWTWNVSFPLEHEAGTALLLREGGKQGDASRRPWRRFHERRDGVGRRNADREFAERGADDGLGVDTKPPREAIEGAFRAVGKDHGDIGKMAGDDGQGIPVRIEDATDGAMFGKEPRNGLRSRPVMQDRHHLPSRRRRIAPHPGELQALRRVVRLVVEEEDDGLHGRDSVSAGSPATYSPTMCIVLPSHVSSRRNIFSSQDLSGLSSKMASQPSSRPRSAR